MPIKDILVHVDSGPHCARRLEVAANVARAHEAHLTGLFVKSAPQMPGYVRAELGPQLLEVQGRFTAEAAAKAEKLFNAATSRAGISAEWRLAEGDSLEALLMHGRYSDLMVLGQNDAENDESPDENDLADQVILDVGRPVLMVPYAGTFQAVGERIMVAWNASRESTRAVADALPILRRAKQVKVLAVNPKGGAKGHGQVPGADIALHLARQGVKAEAMHVVADDMDTGNMLLSRAADEGVDMIVMGAYGRSRLREMILGGATLHMLRHMTVPVLMAH